MVAKEVVDYFTEFNIVKAVGVEDFTDRFNSLLTTVILLVCVLIVGVKQYVLSPILCYASTNLDTPKFMDYLTSWCWVHGTIPLPLNASMPKDDEWDKLDKTDRIVYYQWVPFVLCLQASLFYLPRLVWSIMCRNMAGTDMENIVVMANDAAHAVSAQRANMVNTICGTLELILYDRRRESNNPLRRLLYRIAHWGGRTSDAEGTVERLGSLVRVQYLLLKFVYIGNLLGQLVLIQYFLGFTRFTFGWLVLASLLRGEDWSYTQWFPRVAYCNVNGVQVVGGEQRYIAQCALPLNMLNEKVYIFLWFWFVGLLCLTVFSVFVWIVRIFYQPSQDAFVRKMLRTVELRASRDDSAKNAEPSKDDDALKVDVNTYRVGIDKNVWRLFAHRYLRSDGVFLLRIIQANAGNVIVCDIVRHLWRTYHEKKLADADEQRYGDNVTIRLGKPFPLKPKAHPDSAGTSSLGSSVSTKEPYSGMSPTAPTLTSLKRGDYPDLSGVHV